MYNDCQTQNICSVKLQDWSLITEKAHALHQSDTLYTEEKLFKRQLICLEDTFCEVTPALPLDCGGFCGSNINFWSS